MNTAEDAITGAEMGTEGWGGEGREGKRGGEEGKGESREVRIGIVRT